MYMKLLNKQVVVLSLLFIPIINGLGQKKYIQFHTQDSVVFSYKLSNSRFVFNDSSLMLLLKIENLTAKHIKTEFTIDYFWQALRKSSSYPQSFCLKPNRKIKGRFKGLGYELGIFTNEQILSDDFSFELNELKFSKVSNCKK